MTKKEKEKPKEKPKELTLESLDKRITFLEERGEILTKKMTRVRDIVGRV